MTISALRHAEADDATLLHRARRGDRRAHRIYSRRHAERAVELVELLVAGRPDSPHLASQVLSAAVADAVAGDDALVRCAVRVTAPITDDAGMARLVVALTDGEGRTEDEVAGLIDRPVVDVARLRALAYADVGPAPSVPRGCRGWALVARKDRITADERLAANGHLALCRQCRARLDEQRQSRATIWRRGGAVSAVVVADVVSLSLPAGGAVAGSGVASFVLGKAGLAFVGAAALAMTAASAGVAVARNAPSQPRRDPAPAVGPRQPGGTSSSTPTAHTGNDTTGSQSSGAVDGSSPARTQSPVNESPRIAPVATTAPTTLPTVSVPVQLPTELSTELPTQLPLPTPSISVSAPALPLPTGGPLLGH